MTKIYKSEAGARAVQARYREILKAWPVPNEHLRVPTREGETFVIASGPEDAPAVILFHGSSFNSVTWMGDIESWAKHRRPGAGGWCRIPAMRWSGRPHRSSSSFER